MQHGSVIQTARTNGPDVWQFRWSEKDLNSRRVYRKRVIGTVEQYSDADAVRHSAAGLLAEVNARSTQDRFRAITIAQLCERFEQRELRAGNNLRSTATQKTYRGYLRRWIKPRWGTRRLDDIKAVEVEAWLRSLPLARGSRVKIRNILFNHACRHEISTAIRSGSWGRSVPFWNCR